MVFLQGIMSTRKSFFQSSQIPLGLSLIRFVIEHASDSSLPQMADIDLRSSLMPGIRRNAEASGHKVCPLRVPIVCFLAVQGTDVVIFTASLFLGFLFFEHPSGKTGS